MTIEPCTRCFRAMLGAVRVQTLPSPVPTDAPPNSYSRLKETVQTHDEAEQVVGTLVDNHRRFLSFLERRVGDRAVAEDILQEAFVRGIDRAGAVRDSESSVAWFYRLLRNAVVDYYRSADASRRALAAAATEWETIQVPDDETHTAICQCVRELAATLKPEYADALQRVDVDGAAVRAFADDAGITANNASVRLHRAREALRQRVRQTCGTCAEHGCIDCHCRAHAPDASEP